MSETSTSKKIQSRVPAVWLWVCWVLFLGGAAALVLIPAASLREMARQAGSTKDPRLVPIPAHRVVQDRFQEEPVYSTLQLPTVASESGTFEVQVVSPRAQ